MNRLWVRLSFAFTLVVLCGMLLVGTISFLVNDPSFRRAILLNEIQAQGGLIDTLADYYRAYNSWDDVHPLLAGARASLPFRAENGLFFTLADSSGQIIESSAKWHKGEYWTAAQLENAISIKVDERTVGYFALEQMPWRPGGPDDRQWQDRSPNDDGNDIAGDAAPEEQAERESPPQPPAPGLFFLQFISKSLLWATILFGILGIGFGFIMSRMLTAPLRGLAEAAQAIGARDFSRRVEVRGTDETKEVAIAFNEMVEDLEEAETLRRNLLADVAHELRTPLTVVQGNLRAILDGVYPLEPEEITRLYDQTRLLSRLVGDLHELAQAEAKQLPMNKQPLQLEALIDEAISVFSVPAEMEGITLKAENSEPLPAVQGDPARISQVLNNLLSNALRHTPAGGSITVIAGRIPDAIWFAVQDTGEGIAEADLHHVFDRFYRADRSRNRGTGGSGLGLAIVRAIIEMHGGKVWVDSDGIAGHGSRFTVQLPV